MSEAQKLDPIDHNLHRTKQFIGFAVDVVRCIGFSITPKVHGMENHVVKQMRAIRGGIGELIVYWNEQYHQTGFIYDIKYKHMPGECEKAVVRVKREKISMNQGVVEAKEIVTKNFG